MIRVSGWKSFSLAATAILGIGLALSALASPPRRHTAQPTQGAQISAQDIALRMDTARSKVSWSVDSTLHMVHGTFAMKGGSMHFDPDSGKAGGEFVVSVMSGESGNNSRDEKMHKEVLESGKYPDAVFRPSQVEGKVASSGSSDVKVHGTFLLHGAAHDITVPVHVELDGENWKGTGKFDVPYIEWGLKNPSNFLLKVQPVVNVELEMAGSLKGSKVSLIQEVH
jgi:polyisoprenoid-binding protein YceI